ncbi:MAG: peptide-methionine (S)-S-oxide reductase MsrA [Candidatus Sericytochromatia bacterium]
MARMEKATLGGGCFWCLDAVFRELKGVTAVVSGYAGGHAPDPTYREVTTGETGHAEVVEVSYDPELISFKDLLGVFFAVHDPTTLNRQGADVGTQYRSVILTHDPQQDEEARAMIAALEAEQLFPGRIVTQVQPLERFYPAEAYHQDFLANNPQQPYCAAVVAPKVAKFRKQFLDRLRA